MISSEEFDDALQLILAYKLQLQVELNLNAKKPTINLQHYLTKSTFKILQFYYRSEYEIQIDWSDLKNMESHLLSKINFNKLSGLQGIGKVAVSNLKEILVRKVTLNETC